MTNREANLAAVQLIAQAIGDLNDEAVYATLPGAEVLDENMGVVRERMKEVTK